MQGQVWFPESDESYALTIETTPLLRCILEHACRVADLPWRIHAVSVHRMPTDAQRVLQVRLYIEDVANTQINLSLVDVGFGSIAHANKCARASLPSLKDICADWWLPSDNFVRGTASLDITLDRALSHVVSSFRPTACDVEQLRNRFR